MYVHCEGRIPDGFLVYFHHIDPRIDGLGPEHGPPFWHIFDPKIGQKWGRLQEHHKNIQTGRSQVGPFVKTGRSQVHIGL